MESQASQEAKIRLAVTCVLTERERFPVHMRKSMIRDLNTLRHIDSLTRIVNEWSISRGPSLPQFRAAASEIAKVDGLGFSADSFDTLDRFRNRDKVFYDSMPYTRICDIITERGFSRIKAYALMTHWQHHVMSREMMFLNLDEQEKRDLILAEKKGVTPEQLEIQRKLKSTRSEMNALERKLTPAENQLEKYEELVQKLRSERDRLAATESELTRMLHSIHIID